MRYEVNIYFKYESKLLTMYPWEKENDSWYKFGFKLLIFVL